MVGHTYGPDAYKHHDVSDVHLLQNPQKLLARAILSIVVETLGQYLLLLNGISLRDSISE